MKLTWPGAVKAPVQTEETHVLHWVPGYLNGDGMGCWDLQEIRAYEDGEDGSACPRSWDPRNAVPETLAEWLEGQLGYPVTLVLDWHTLSSVSFRPLALNRSREPVYYVSRRGTA